MLDIPAINAQLVQQDAALRAVFARAVATGGLDPAMRTLVEAIGEGLAAIHERQGNMITLMLQTR